MRSPDAVAGVAFITMFPLTCPANAFVPVDGPQAVAEWIPASAASASAGDRRPADRASARGRRTEQGG